MMLKVSSIMIATISCAKLCIQLPATLIPMFEKTLSLMASFIISMLDSPPARENSMATGPVNINPASNILSIFTVADTRRGYFIRSIKMMRFASPSLTPGMPIEGRRNSMYDRMRERAILIDIIGKNFLIDIFIFSFLT